MNQQFKNACRNKFIEALERYTASMTTKGREGYVSDVMRIFQKGYEEGLSDGKDSIERSKER